MQGALKTLAIYAAKVGAHYAPFLHYHLPFAYLHVLSMSQSYLTPFLTVSTAWHKPACRVYELTHCSRTLLICTTKPNHDILQSRLGAPIMMPIGWLRYS